MTYYEKALEEYNEAKEYAKANEWKLTLYHCGIAHGRIYDGLANGTFEEIAKCTELSTEVCALVCEALFH